MPTLFTCDGFAERLDELLDGDLSPDAADALHAHAAACPACAAELAFAGHVQHTLHAAPRAVCPPTVAATALEQATRPVHAVRAADRPATKPPRRRRALWTGAGVLVLALAALLALPYLRADVPVETAAAETYTAEEVAAARRDLELALALVSDAGERTGLYLGRDVIAPHVVAPIQQGLDAQ